MSSDQERKIFIRNIDRTEAEAKIKNILTNFGTCSFLSVKPSPTSNTLFAEIVYHNLSSKTELLRQRKYVEANLKGAQIFSEAICFYCFDKNRDYHLYHKCPNVAERESAKRKTFSNNGWGNKNNFNQPRSQFSQFNQSFQSNQFSQSNIIPNQSQLNEHESNNENQHSSQPNTSSPFNLTRPSEEIPIPKPQKNSEEPSKKDESTLTVIKENSEKEATKEKDKKLLPEEHKEKEEEQEKREKKCEKFLIIEYEDGNIEKINLKDLGIKVENMNRLYFEGKSISVKKEKEAKTVEGEKKEKQKDHGKKKKSKESKRGARDEDGKFDLNEKMEKLSIDPKHQDELKRYSEELINKQSQQSPTKDNK